MHVLEDNLRAGWWCLPEWEEERSQGMSCHEPVMPAEVLEFLAPAEGMVFLDATLGAGGHSGLLLGAGAQVIGMDQDAEALGLAAERLGGFGGRFRAVHANFRELGRLFERGELPLVDGVLADLGVSSMQLDTAGRGFSFQRNGPLDMRMNPSGGVTAAEILNTAPAEELVRIFRDFGEEPFAARIASRVVQWRKRQIFRTTLDLVAIVDAVSPRRGPRHPATRVFQALRIAVNDELGALEEFLAAVPRVLRPGGVLCVVSFHSLEDRMVKRSLKDWASPLVDAPEWPEPRRNPNYCMKLLTPSPVCPRAEETSRNPRARSAKLRAGQKLPISEV